MKPFCLVWQSLLDSTLWVGSTKETKVVWITMLVLKDKNGDIHITLAGLAHRAVVTIEECGRAIEFLCQPDEYSGNKECEGRRIVPIEGGWHVVSHEKYRFSSEAKRVYWRESKRVQRNKARNGVEFDRTIPVGPSPGEPDFKQETANES